MMCHVIIHDYVSAHQIAYILTQDDFSGSEIRPLADLHAEIMQRLTEMDLMMHADTRSEANRHLVRLLCSLVTQIGGRHSIVNLLRLHRVDPTNLFYDYSASMSL